MFRYSLIALFFLSLPVAGQDAATPTSPVGLPVDWSFRHLIHGRPWTGPTEATARREPRVLYDWMKRQQVRSPSSAGVLKRKTKFGNRVDWNFTLGAGKVANNMAPAKYTFNVTATPSCSSDYVVFALDTAGSSSQPNLVRFNNLYSEPGGTGFCTGATGPSVLSAYNITSTATNGAILTSPAISLDGTQVAFIETISSPIVTSVFHVLKWGTTGSNGSFDTGTNTYTADVPGSSNNATMSTLQFSSSTTTFSSPWIDYHNNVAYFGDDNGKLYKTTCAFNCATPPAIVPGWSGGFGPGLQIAPAGVKLGSPVVDSTSNKLFVGGSDGNLYGVNLAVCPPTCPGMSPGSVAVGSANTFGGVLDAPMVDVTFGTVFAFAGDNGSGAGIVLQTNTSLALSPSNINVPMGNAAFNIPDGTFDDAYYTNTLGSATAVGHLYTCGSQGGSGQPALYTIPFTNTGTLSTSNPPKMGSGSHQNIPGNSGIGCSPLVELKNGATDRLFFSQSQVPSTKCTTATPVDGCMFMYDITSGTPTGPTTAVENNGTSGIIVDNTSANAQASSIYFSNQGTASCTIGAATPAYCAIKLTQSALQ